MRRFPTSFFLISIFTTIFPTSEIDAHDIPKQRVDRTIQIQFEPARMRLQYALELDDTTIAADLRRLQPGPLPPDPDEWLSAYGKIIARLIPQAFRLTGPDNRQSHNWRTIAIERHREQHTVYEFTYETALPESGRWNFSDENFQASEGLSRLGVKAAGGVEIKSQEFYPHEAKNIAYQPVWMLDEAAMKRTKSWQGEVRWKELKSSLSTEIMTAKNITKPSVESRLTLIGAFLLGLWHTMQPGHGKSWLMASSMLVRTKGPKECTKLIFGWALSHFIVLFLLAVVAWFLPISEVAMLSNALRLLAALLIACPAAERLGRLVGEIAKTEPPRVANLPQSSTNALGTGMVAGMVPCWEAVGLLLLGLSAGYPIQGLLLVLSFVSGSLFLMIMLILFADFILRHFTISGFLGYIFNMAINLVVLAAGLRLLWQTGGID